MSEDEKSYTLKQMHDRNVYLQKENQRLNNVLNEIEGIIYNTNLTGIEARLAIQEVLDKYYELKESDNHDN